MNRPSIQSWALTFFLVVVMAQIAWANPVKEKFGQAMNAFLRKDYPRAVTLFEETLAMYPDFAQPYNFIAMAKKEMGASDEEVVELLEKAVAIDPDFALAHDNLGKIYYGQGEFQKAKEHALRAVEIDPDLATARLSLAWIALLGFGETRQAIEQFEAAIRLQKTDYARFGLGMAYFMDHQRGKVLEMITSLRQEGNDALAQDLEEMIREGRYLPPKGVQSLVHPKQARQPTPAQEKKPAPIPNVEYPVRLSGQLEQRAPSGQPNNTGEALTGTERIRQLQRNYPVQGQDY